MNKPNGRQLAQFVLDRIEQRSSYINLALPEIFREYEQTDRRERAFCTELVYGVYRHLMKIDYFLGRLLCRPLASLKITVKNVLRIALYQLICLPEIPERAVIYTAVEQVKNSRYQGLAPLVNGVLRAYLRNKDSLKVPDDINFLEYLAIEYSHPQWLVERWFQRFGPEITEEIIKTNNRQPPLTLRVNQHLTTIPMVLAELENQEVRISPGLILPEAFNIGAMPGPIEELPAFAAGKVFIQDESSMLVAHLLNPVPGETIIDLCAAPGGKSTHMAELMQNKGKIISVDDYDHKIKLINENAKRLQLSCIEARLGDARNFELSNNDVVDAVLVDAPCTGTGVLRRRVDARYRRKPEDISKLVEIQREILHQAVKLVRPGGRLIYSTCTLEPEEDQEQVQWFLENHPEFELADYRSYLPKEVEKYAINSAEKWLTILPIPNGGDGFFMCRLEKTR